MALSDANDPSPEPLDPLAWLRSTRRRIFIDTQFPDWTRPGQSGGAVGELRGVATNLDPERIVAEAAAAGAQVIVAFAKCQFGNHYHDTELGHKHAGLGDVDWLAEVVSHAHRRGLRVMAYYSNRWDVETARAHPEWMAVDATGGRSYDRWPFLCLRSPYRDLVVAQLREIVDRYDVDGIWSDIVHGPPCYCEGCAARFGRPMPRGPEDDDWLALLRWHQGEITDYLTITRAAVKDTRPDTAFVVNHFGSIYVDASLGLSTAHLALSDCASTEGYAEWHGLLYPGFAAASLAGTAPGRPSEVLVSRFASTWDYSLKPTAQMRFEAFSVAASGAAVCFDDEPYHDGTLEPAATERIGEVLHEMERRDPWLDLDRWVTDVAVYVSQTSRELATMLDAARPYGHHQFPPLDLNPGPSDLVPSVMGAYKALVEAQLLVGVVSGPVATAADGGPRVLCLPGVITLDADEASWIERFVADGGGLVATGPTSLHDTHGRRKDTFGLADLFGVDVDAAPSVDYTYVVDPGSGRPFPQYLPTLPIRPVRPDVETVAGRRRPIIDSRGELYFHNNQAAPWTDLPHPSIVRRTHGLGRVVYIAGSPEGNVARFGSEDHARTLVDAVRWAGGSGPLVWADGPTGMRVTAGWKGPTLVVHLVTATPDQTVRLGPDRTLETITRTPKLYGVSLLTTLSLASATIVPDGQRVSIHRSGAATRVQLDRVEDWVTLLLEVAPAS